MEYEIGLASSINKKLPLATYWAQVRLRCVIDLEDSATLDLLRLTNKDLHAAWRDVSAFSIMQMLGCAISSNTLGISAMRYPSDAAAKAGKKGFNIVIYRDCVKHPDSVHILGAGRKVLQQWP